MNTENSHIEKDLSFIENIKVIKKEKPKQNPTQEIYSRTNYLPLSSVLTNIPNSQKLKEETSPNYLKPLKGCLDQFEFLENKHSIISKLPNRNSKDQN
jgi:hypothetical protein